MCSLTHGVDNDSEGGDDHADDLVTRKSQKPQMGLEYSASRDPNKLEQKDTTNQKEGGFKVGNQEHEAKITANMTTQKWKDWAMRYVFEKIEGVFSYWYA